MIIALPISKSQVNRAKVRYSFGVLNGSITKGKSSIFGALGEILVLDYFADRNVIDEPTYDYDLIIDGHKVDVKTKATTVEPKNNYLCSISCANTHQKCDYYFFVRVDKSMEVGYLLGYIHKNSFYSLAFKKNKGDLDVNGFVFKDDCYNIAVEKLNPFNATHTQKAP